jgi:hypothetical protein
MGWISMDPIDRSSTVFVYISTPCLLFFFLPSFLPPPLSHMIDLKIAPHPPQNLPPFSAFCFLLSFFRHFRTSSSCHLCAWSICQDHSLCLLLLI